MLQEVTNDARMEPILKPLTGDEKSIGAKVSVEARGFYISGRGFWCREQRALCSNVRNAKCIYCHRPGQNNES